MVNATEALCLVLVGAFWGFTNPFMRKGFAETKATNKQERTDTDVHGVKSNVSAKLILLTNIKVWLPYIINQIGSLLYYKTLASSNLTLSVPICNATAMVFASITSALLGEKVDRPGRAALGVILVLSGVGVCMYSSEKGIGRDVRNWEVLQHGEL